MASWRKNRNGEWVVFGSITEVNAGDWVTVTKANGTSSRVKVDTVTRPFDVNGVPHVYGTPAKRDSGTVRIPAGANAETVREAQECCAECGTHRGPFKVVQDSSGIPGPCCPRCQRISRFERSFA